MYHTQSTAHVQCTLLKYLLNKASSCNKAAILFINYQSFGQCYFTEIIPYM